MKNFDRETLIGQEKEMLGVYITDHPLREYEEQIAAHVTVTSQDLADVLESEQRGETHSFVRDGMSAVMAGIITSKKTLITKNNKMMAFVGLEDLMGTAEVVVFPNIYERFSNLVEEDKVVSIAGTINFKEEEMPKLLADKIVSLKEIGALHERKEPAGIVKIKLPEGNAQAILESIKRIMQQHKGDCQVIIYMTGGKSFRTDSDLWVNPDAGFRHKIVNIVGEENYKG